MQVPACMSSQYLPTYTRPLQKSWLSCMNMNANIRVVYNPVGENTHRKNRKYVKQIEYFENNYAGMRTGWNQ